MKFIKVPDDEQIIVLNNGFAYIDGHIHDEFMIWTYEGEFQDFDHCKWYDDVSINHLLKYSYKTEHLPYMFAWHWINGQSQQLKDFYVKNS